MMNQFVAAGVVVGVGAGAAWGQSSFTLIEPAPGHTMTRMSGVSADGSVVAGYSTGVSVQSVLGYTWTAAGGRFDYGAAAGVPANVDTLGISGDGLTVVGNVRSSPQIFRWSAAGGYQSIPGAFGYSETAVIGTSIDGSTIVANGTTTVGGIPTGRALRWTASGGYQDLGALPDGAAQSIAKGVSRDGNVVVGYNNVTGGGPLHAFAWTTQSGMQPLEPAVNSPFFESEGRGVSGNGLVAFGAGDLPSGTFHPFRWTSQSGIEDLGAPAGVLAGGIALHSNFDGSVLACSFDFGGDYLWRLSSGYIKVDTFLTQSGITLPAGYSALDVMGMSDDARTLVGELSLPGNVRRGFVAVVPAPASATIIGAGLVAVATRARRVAGNEGGVS